MPTRSKRVPTGETRHDNGECHTRDAQCRDGEARNDGTTPASRPKRRKR
jgi:hypothetical protein